MLLQHVRAVHFARLGDYMDFAERQTAAVATGLLAAVHAAPEGHTWGVQVVETVEDWEAVDTTVLGSEARMRQLGYAPRGLQPQPCSAWPPTPAMRGPPRP